MSTVSLTVKPVSGDGTTSYVDGNNLPAAELQADFDAIVNWANGDIDENNISSSAQIANSQLADIAATKVTAPSSFTTTTSPGDSATPSAPTTYSAEAARSFYKMAGLRGYLTNVKYMNASGVATDATWFEPRVVGPNLLKNPGFEVQSGGAGTAPDGWSLVSTPATVAIENPAFDEYGLEKRSLNIVTNGANEGISTTVSGLKDGVKYLVGMAYTITDNGTTPGVIRLSTSNGLAAGAYQNLALDGSTEAASTVVVTQGIVKPTSAPTIMTISITATESGADFNVLEAWMYELGESYPVSLPSIPTETKRVTSATTYPSSGWTGTGATWRTETLTGLSVTRYIPASGYRLIYEVSVPFKDIDSAAGREGSRLYLAIQANIDGGGASTVAGPVYYETIGASSDIDTGGTMTCRYVLDNPTPGSSYAMTTLLGVYDDSDFEQVSIPPSVGGVQMAAESRLILERL